MKEGTTPSPSTQPLELPPEILGNIFQLTVADWEGYTIRRLLLDLCLVCRSWYDAALLENRMWGKVVLNIANGDESQSYEKLVTSLTRAPVAFRSVKAKFGLRCECYKLWVHHEGRFLIKCDHQVLYRLMQDGPTLHHFDMECWSSSCFERLCQGTRLSSGQSSLESLKLTIRFGWIYEDPDHTPLRHVPPLKRLELELLSAVPYDLGDSSPAVLFVSSSIGSSLTSLTITFPAYFECPDYISNFLSWCTNLESLTMTYAGQIDNHLPHRLPTTPLPKLKSLSLWGIRPHFEGTALHYLRTPALATLTIRVHGYPTPLDGKSPPRTILDLMQSLGVLSPTSFTLHSLTLWGERGMIIRVGVEELAGILAALPSLRYLSLNSIHFDAEQLLEASRRSRAFAPALEHLDLQGLYREFKLQHLLQFVKGRVVERVVGQGSQLAPALRTLTLSHWEGATVLSETYAASPLVPELRTTFGLKIVRTVL